MASWLPTLARKKRGWGPSLFWRVKDGAPAGMKEMIVIFIWIILYTNRFASTSHIS